VCWNKFFSLLSLFFSLCLSLFLFSFLLYVPGDEIKAGGWGWMMADGLRGGGTAWGCKASKQASENKSRVNNKVQTTFGAHERATSNCIWEEIRYHRAKYVYIYFTVKNFKHLFVIKSLKNCNFKRIMLNAI
jgi:hypothetical protein